MNKISHIRAQLGVTQSAMAEALGMSQGNVSNYENGQTVPPYVADKLIKYAATFGVSLSYDLIYGAPDQLEAPPTLARPDPNPREEPDRGRRKPINVDRIMTISKDE